MRTDDIRGMFNNICYKTFDRNCSVQYDSFRMLVNGLDGAESNYVVQWVPSNPLMPHKSLIRVWCNQADYDDLNGCPYEDSSEGVSDEKG